MKNNRANRHNDRGFTLSEVLLTGNSSWQKETTVW